jgi:hypothetical protein
MKSKVSLILLISLIFCFTCKTTKHLPGTTIEVPFSGKQYQTDKDFFRAKQSGNSPDLSTAKKIALQNAKAELASSINTTIKSVTEQYTNQRSFNDKQEFESKFEENVRAVVSQEISDVKIIGEKLLKEDNGTYTYWIAIETSKLAVQNNLQKRISSDQKLQLDYDKTEFMKIFDSEMEKFGK